MRSGARSMPARSSVGSRWPDVPGTRLLRCAAAFYGLAWAVHTADHVRRGFDVLSAQVRVLGTVAAVLQLVAVGAVLLRWRWAPIAAMAVGFPDAMGITAVHLLPRWSSFSDAFPGAHGTGVNAFSWMAAILEIAGAVGFGLAGTYAWRRTAL